MSNKTNQGWKRFQGKKPPSKDTTRSQEVSKGASACADGASPGETLASQIPDTGQDSLLTPTPPPTIRPNLRNYKQLSWSVEEKKTIYYCHAYSRCEVWTKGKDKIFQKQIDLSNLDQQKLQESSLKKLSSIASQIGKYLTKDTMDEIRQQANAKAVEDLQYLGDTEKKEIDKATWSLQERWTLVWAKEYAKTKTFKNASQRAAEWRRIFFHFCPDKEHIPPNTLNTQNSNILRKKYFSDEQIAYMKDEIKIMLENATSPLESPIKIENVQYENQEVEIPPEPTPPDTSQPYSQNETIRTIDSQQGQVLPAEMPILEHDHTRRQSQTHEASLLEGGNATITPDISTCPDEHSEPEDDTVLEPEFESDPVDEEMERISDELINTIEEVKNMSMKNRPKLIKLVENKQFKTMLKQVNFIMNDIIEIDVPLTELNNTTYGAALYIQRKLAPWYDEKRPKRSRAPKKESTWKIKIQKKIQNFRKELSLMLQTRPLTKRLALRVHRIQRKYKIRDTNMRDKIAEHQAEIKGLAAQLKNKERKIDQKVINKQFAENPRKVYRELTRESIQIDKPPQQEDLDQFWRPLYEERKIHTEGDWINLIKDKNENKNKMPTPFIDPSIIKTKILTYGNFKSPGIDKIPNFWLKKLHSLHPHYASSFTKLVKGETVSPEWLTHGITTLLPKSHETHNPQKYRPITCLSTTYKLLTGIISDALYRHLVNGQYLEEEQKGCIRNRMGTKDQLLINKTVLEDCKRRARNLSMAWIDYRKAFDSVPHTWILRCLELYNVGESLVRFLEKQIKYWKTDMTLHHSNGEVNITNININRGIFQGDSLSPLLFCLTLDPLSKILKNQGIGYNMSKRGMHEEKSNISHLMFMDDIKLYADSDANLKKLIKSVHQFSSDIHMEFGLDKCAKCTIKQGKKADTDDMQLEEGTVIADLQEENTYKYLGIEENASIEHKKMRSKIHTEYLKRVKKICKSQLTAKNKVTAINQLAIPVVTYGFGVVNWPQSHLNSLDVKTRKILTLHKVIYRNQCLDRLYMPRNEGGVGLTEINAAFRSTMVSLGQYLLSNSDPLIQIVTKQHEETLPQSTSITKLFRNFAADIFEQYPTERKMSATSQAKEIRTVFSMSEMEKRKVRWGDHKRAGLFPKELEKPYIDKQTSLNWLKKGRLKFDDERLIIAAQDQGLMTNGFKKMAKLTNDDRCRFCHVAVESITHLVSSCQTLLADGRYTARHNKVCRYLHWTVCNHYKIETGPVWLHEPNPITATEDVSVFYDKNIVLGRYVEGGAIKPDIVVWDKIQKNAKIIEVSVPNDYGINRAEREKMHKYQDLKNDLRTTWDLDSIDIIPVIVGATGLLKTNMKDYLKSIPGEPVAEEIQMAAITGTKAILKRALSH